MTKSESKDKPKAKSKTVAARRQLSTKGGKPKVSNRTLTIQAGPRDVLFGRGSGVGQHPGNAMFRQIVDKYRDQYRMKKKIHKCLVSKQVVAEIHKKGGRFLDETPASRKKKNRHSKEYEEVPLDRAIAKAAQALRENYTSDVRTSNIRHAIQVHRGWNHNRQSSLRRYQRVD